MRSSAGRFRGTVPGLPLALASSLLLLTTAIGCASTGAPPPASAYEANVTLTLTPAPETTVTTVLVEKYRERMRRREVVLESRPVITIDRPDLRVTWTLNPAEKTFEEFAIHDENAKIDELPNPFGPRAQTSFEELGTDSVEGQAATKYAVTGGDFAGLAWIRPDGIPVRFEGSVRIGEKDVPVEIVYESVVPGVQPLYDFAIPQNYAGFADRKQKRNRDGSNGSNGDVDRIKDRLKNDQMRTKASAPYVPF